MEQEQEQKPEFVRVEITERQFITHGKPDLNGHRNPLFVSDNGVAFGKIICPENGTIWFPVKNMQVYENKFKETFDGQKLRMYHFDFPKGTMFDIHFPGGMDENGAYKEDIVKQISIEDLKEVFYQARVDYAKDNSQFVNFEVPKSFDKTPEDGKYARISIPIDIDGENKYYTFIVPRDQFKDSTKNEGFCYFGFPRMNMNEDRPWEINLRHSEEAGVDASGQKQYNQTEITLSSADLKVYVDAAVAASANRHFGDSHSLLDDMDFGPAQISENEVNDQVQSADMQQTPEAPAPVEDENQGMMNTFHRSR